MWLFYLFAAPLVLQTLASLRGGARYLDFFRRELAAPWPDFAPFASVIVPCRGLDQNLRANLAPLFVQDYAAYELIFVLDDADDPSRRVLADVRREFMTDEQGATPSGGVKSARVIVAGRARESGQKVHNLRAAVREVSAACEVLVFVDTDARPRRDWLRVLVAPLADEGVGAATGYRWFVPARGGLASHLRAVWNASIASALGANARANFCWGGSTAVRRSTFERLDVRERWRGTLSDDFTLTRVLREAGLPIRFVPACLTASHEDCGWGELFEFTTRQLKITRVYAPHLWRTVLASSLLFCAVFYGGLALAAARALLGRSVAVPLGVLASIYLLGSAKAALRLRAVSLVLTGERERPTLVAWLVHLTLWPLASALYLYNALAAACSRRLAWRGIAYELKSATETVVVGATANAGGRPEQELRAGQRTAQ